MNKAAYIIIVMIIFWNGVTHTNDFNYRYAHSNPVNHYQPQPGNPRKLWGCPMQQNSWNNGIYPLFKPPVPSRANPMLLTPAIFGAAAALTVGFSLHGRSFSSGYSKFIFFVNIYAVIASLGAGAYIFETLTLDESKDAKLKDIIFPLITIILFFALLFNLVYTLYPSSFSGTIGKTRVTQFISFLSLSIGSISVGETFNVTPEKSGTQIMAAVESFWNLFVLSLLISLIT
ncbi:MULTISPECIES: hypothetical protein [unclassified Dehalobacter]|uniref:hypothetical protein n=2 Tax=Dehalobacter TaxID=56112 RepID=UPI000E6D1B6C|nr:MULTISPECIES: hypothetical protein [unclassified Dehalobacter]RJE47578.1 hypothetical protein A7K50_02695 [Dehalobacter sp. MCB1]TCX48609.1 hypothetical protein C1I36_10995 [Dehalobacter sp. 14DCB1]TCX56342.1 hypothetical protein C1I38_02195 [Dehalobacter sp. 12DCB1]